MVGCSADFGSSLCCALPFVLELDGSFWNGVQLKVLPAEGFSQDETKVILDLPGPPPSQAEMVTIRNRVGDYGEVRYLGLLPTCTGDIRAGSAEEAEAIASELDGTILRGAELTAKLDPGANLDPWASEGKLVVVSGLHPLTTSVQLKEHIVQMIDTVDPSSAFVVVKPTIAEVRFADPSSATAAAEAIDGTEFRGVELQVEQSQDRPTKVMIMGFSPRTTWWQLRDLFEPFGKVEFAAVLSPKRPKRKSSWQGEDEEEDAEWD